MRNHHRAIKLGITLALLYVAARLLWGLTNFWALWLLLMLVALAQGH